jgi:hypothetical protein
MVLFALGSFTASLARAESERPRFELVLSNDILAGDVDDRYTAALSAHAPLGTNFVVVFSERMFTDRDAGLRFDETRVALGRHRLGVGNWQVDASFGVVHVGRGLLGESVQNAVHRLVAADPVDLDYVDQERLYAEVVAQAHGPSQRLGPLVWRPEFEIGIAPGFANQAVGRVVADAEIAPWLGLSVSVGARWATSNLDLLERHLEPLAAELSVSVLVADRLSLTWTDNAFGTGDDHVHLAWRLAGPGRYRDRD